MRAKTRRRARPGIVLPPVNRSSRASSESDSSPSASLGTATDRRDLQNSLDLGKSASQSRNHHSLGSTAQQRARRRPPPRRSGNEAPIQQRTALGRGRSVSHGGRVSGADGPTRRSPAKSRRARRRATQRARGRAHRLTETQFTFHYLGPRREHDRSRGRRRAGARAERH